MAKILRISGELERLSVEAEMACTDDRCLVVFAVTRDCAFKLKTAADNRLAALADDRP